MSVEFKDYSAQVKAAMGESAISALYAAAGEIQAAAVKGSPVDSGQLRNSWAYVVDEEKMVATIGSPLENALWNEFGTGEYALEGKGRKTPWYVPVEGYTGSKPPTYNGRVVVVYGKDGVAFYKTNGKKPQRTLHSAFIQSRNTVKQLCEKEMRTLNSKKSSGGKTSFFDEVKKGIKSGKSKKKNSFVDAVKKGVKVGKNPSINIPKPKSGNSAFSRGVKKGNAIAKKISGK